MLKESLAVKDVSSFHHQLLFITPKALSLFEISTFSFAPPFSCRFPRPKNAKYKIDPG